MSFHRAAWCCGIGILAAVWAVGCASATGGSAEPSTTPDGLVVAENPACVTLGRSILKYLKTGVNGGNPQLDLQYGASVGAPAARAIADKAILNCDAAPSTARPPN